uniref:PIF1/LRR1 pleckstrin homology domain-containing protein n=1 Tax=Glossina brevipalpis TaxID=37001 RepID=A0A1A9WZU5_9MUSC
MKILCETQVINRHTQTTKSPRMVKATLAVGYHRTAKDDSESSRKSLEIIHFTPQNKLGTRYKIYNNVEKIFTKFLQDGKATISFKQPAENLLIKCDPIQLKGFLQTLKLGLEGKGSLNLRTNIAATTAIPQKSQPQIKMTITNRSDYPTKGFPRTLRQLTVTGIQLCKITFEMCSLKNLTVLNLSYNNIEKVPLELGRLPLTQLDVSNNGLGADKSWLWLNSKTLRETLRELDFSANKLDSFPRPLVRLEKLVSLKLNNNFIKRIPFAIRRMHSLRYLSMSSNQLESLPSSFNSTRLDLLDVWGNNFQPHREHEVDKKKSVEFGTPSALWLLACRAVHQYKLSYSANTLPWTLVDILTEAPKCACGTLCYGHKVYEQAALCAFENIQNLVFSRDRLIYADIVLCGHLCMGKKQMLASN